MALFHDPGVPIETLLDPTMTTADDSTRSLGRVLITGGCGFLGHHIVSLLLEQYPSSRISVLDLRTTRNRISNPNISYHDGDITNLESVQQIFSQLRPDVVIHTASPVFNANNPELMLKVNLNGTKNLLKAAQETGVKAFVYTSSASIIMDKRAQLINADERWPLVTGDAQPEYYSTTKAYAETAVLSANRTPSTFLTCAIRPAGIFGEGDVQSLPKIITASRKGQSIFQIGPNDNLFDVTYVQNVAHAHLLAASALLRTHSMLPTIPLDTERVDGEAFFITNDSPIYFWDFARQVFKEAGDVVPLNKVWVLQENLAMVIGTILEWVFWVLGKTPNLTRQQVKYSCITRYYNIDKAKRRLRYRPIVELEEGIKRGVKYFLEEEAAEREKKG